MSARPPRDCLAQLAQLSAYIDDELTPTQRRAIEAHCRGCARCRGMIAGLRRTVALYRSAGATPMPARLRVRARARIARLLEQHLRSDRPPRQVPRRS